MADVAMKKEVEKTADDKSEKKDEKANGEAKGKVEESEEAKKAEVLLEQKLKEVQKNIKRFAPHSIPKWELQQSKERCTWHVRIFPFDQEDCKNCIMEEASKIAYKALYCIPKRRNGAGFAELFMISNNDVVTVMGRIIRMPFFYRYVTVELTRRTQEAGKGRAPNKTTEETATIVFETSKCVRTKNITVSKEGQKSLWVRYLTENTSPEFLRAVFPLSRSADVQTHDNLRVGIIEVNSTADLHVLTRAYITVIINGRGILSICTREPTEKESVSKAELELALKTFALKSIPTEVVEKHIQRRDDKNETARILKRTLHQQNVGDQPASKRSRVDLPAQRGIGGNYWSSGSQFTGFGGQINPQSVTAGMVMMQARLNQTLRNQLLLLNPNASRGFNTGFGGSFTGTGIRGLRGSVGNKGFGGGW